MISKRLAALELKKLHTRSKWTNLFVFLAILIGVGLEGFFKAGFVAASLGVCAMFFVMDSQRIAQLNTKYALEPTMTETVISNVQANAANMFKKPDESKKQDAPIVK